MEMAMRLAARRVGLAIGLCALLLSGLASTPAAKTNVGLPNGSNDGLAVCFAEGTPPDVIQAVNEAIFGPSGPRYNAPDDNRWPGARGTPVEITWSLVPDGTIVPGRFGADDAPSTLFATLDAQFGDRQLWIGLLEQSFARWGSVAGTSYRFVHDADSDWDDGAEWGTPGDGVSRGDVRIYCRDVDGNGSVLAFNFFPTSGNSAGDMVLDAAEDWANPDEDFLFFRNVIQHEHGHGLGLYHICPPARKHLMEPFINRGFDGVQHDELRAAHRLYGDALEPNNAPAEATELGVLAYGPATTVGAVPAPEIFRGSTVSIDDTSDVDYYRVRTNGNRELVVRVVPIGRFYDDSVQDCPNGDGGCCSGNNRSTRSIADLRVELFDAASGSVLASVNEAVAGDSELLRYPLADAAGYLVRVSAANEVNETQLYQLEVAVGSVCPGDLDFDDDVDTGDLAALLLGWGTPAGDVNFDGVTDFADFAQLSSNFGCGL